MRNRPKENDPDGSRPGGAGGAILSVLSGGLSRKILSYVNICEFWRKGPKKVGGSFLKIPLRFSERY